jgi:hypothetical protein
VSWDITPTSAGVIRLAIKLVDFKTPVLATDWFATIAVDRDLLRVAPSGTLGTPGRWNTEFVSGNKYPPFTLSRQSPAIHTTVMGDSLDVDLSAMQLGYSVNVLTSLGVTDTTYSYLSLAGTALAAMLGTGWAWKLQSLATRKKEKPGGDEQ